MNAETLARRPRSNPDCAGRRAGARGRPIDTFRWRIGGLAAAALIAGAAALAVAADPPEPAAAPEKPGKAGGSAPEVIVHASELPKSALSEFARWKDPASPGGLLVGTPNQGDELDPPPENDPHVTFKVDVKSGVAYRCWVHMKVGKPKGKSQANLVYVQFTDAVDEAGKEALKPRTKSYLTLRGPAREGWAWVGHDAANPKSPAPLVRFRTGGEVTVRIQAGMEGVGFDQFLLSPARFLEKPPAEAVVKK